MFQALPGFRDFYPEDCAIRNFVFRQWRQTAIRHGFQEFDAPILESLELLEAKSGPEIVSQLFSFADKAERRVTLRPELTPSLARMVGARAGSIKRPVKWFSIGENFRYEKPQKGRLRAFYQFNADILGEAGVAADAEIIALLAGVLRSFGLTDSEYKIRLSDRDLWLLLLQSQALTGADAAQVLGVIDKMEREDRETSRKKLAAIPMNDTPIGLAAASRLLERIDAFRDADSLDAIERIFNELDLTPELSEQVAKRLTTWRELLDRLDALGTGALVRIDLSIVRGLAYYTGFVFEAFQTVGKGRAIAGGGRYDDLVNKLAGTDMPAVGFGMGDVVLTDLIQETRKMPALIVKPDVYVVIGSVSAQQAALQDIAQLRELGYVVEYPLKQQGFSKQFRNANQSGAAHCVIYADDELANGVVKLRNMSEGTELECPRSQLTTALAQALSGADD